MAAALGAVLGALAGPGMESGASAAMANEAFQRSKHVSNRQMAAAQFLSESTPSWAMEGLRKAGLNPILAASSGMGGAQFAQSSGVGAARAGQIPDLGSSARAGAKFAPEKKVLEEAARRGTSEADAAFYEVGRSRAAAETEYQRMRAEELRVDQVRETTELLRQQQAATAAAAAASRATESRTRYQEYLDRTRTPYSDEQKGIVRKAFRELTGRGEDE